MPATLGRSHALENAARLANRGDLGPALREYDRLFQQNPGDWSVGNTLGDLYVRAGKATDAVSVFMGLAERLANDGFAAKARALYRKILRIQPENAIALQRVDELEKPQVGQASPFLQRVLETARSSREAVAAESRLARRAQVEAPAQREPAPDPEGFGPVEAEVGAAMARRDFRGAAARIENFLEARPRHVAALEKLIEVGVEGELDATVVAAQVRLAHVCLEDGRYPQAREIAIDLIIRESDVRHRELLDRVVTIARAHGVILPPTPPLDPIGPAETLPSPETSAPAAPAPASATAPPPAAPADVPPRAPLERPPERPAAAPAPPATPGAGPIDSARSIEALLAEWADPQRTLDEVRDALLDDAATAAEDRLAEASRLIEAQELDQALRTLEVAMCTPHLRVPAGSRAARIHRDRGALIEALACLEWVAEMPPSTEESGHELAYELAVTLEALGQQAQALGVYRELLAEVGPTYRDVANRVERLNAA